MLIDQMTDADRVDNFRVADRPLRLAGIFQSGAVLQRDRLIPVWGQAAPRARIEATFGPDRAVTFANDQGDFFLKLPAQSAGENLTLCVTDGQATLQLTDIAVGEVFLLAGQSNMEYDLANLDKAEFPRPKYPVRAFRVKPHAFPGAAGDVSGAWQTLADGRGFSAVGAFFGAKIADTLAVPVGLVDVSRGGVGTETYISEACLARDPVFSLQLAEYEAQRFAPENNPETSGDGIVNSRRLLRSIAAANPATPPPPANWETTDFDDETWPTVDLPDSWSASGYPTTGVFLFRKKVEIPPDWVGQNLTLSLGICDRADQTFVNGKLIGKTGRGNSLAHYDTVRRYPIRAEIVSSAALTLAVQITNFCSICTFGGMIGPEKEMYLACGEKQIPLAGSWKMLPHALTGCKVMEQMAFTGAGEAKSFHMLYDNSLKPLENLSFRAALFYQGEANTLNHPEHYGALLAGVIKSWRNLWGNPDLPILVFDLPGFQRPHLYSKFSQWAIVRQKLLETTLRETGLPPVAMIDCGDVDQLHPPDKRRPGERAADMMLAILRGETPPSGAVCRQITMKKDRAILHFQLFGSELADFRGEAGVVGITPDGEIQSLPVVETTDSELILALPPNELSTIAYCWCDNPANGKLRTQAQLPVFPFRFNLTGEGLK